MNKKAHRSLTLFATPLEQRMATTALGVSLPPKYQKRYERLHRQKILELRHQLESDDWYERCFPR